jgi:putative spermidine/putrescine transport system ATP-binding protein
MEGSIVTLPQRAAALAAEGIGKRFGAVRALDDVSLDVRRGEFLTLLGPSGSGKTTFLMILAGFTRPDSGRLRLDGADITDQAAEARSFGMVFQGYALFPHLTVEANIAFPLRVRRMPAAARRARVAEMVARVGLEAHARKLPDQLSGGQQQRVALARALAFAPKLLLLDEPFSALDKGLRGQMQDEVRRLHRETGTTFVFVTHDQSEALALSSRIAIFDHGRLLQLGPPRAVYERPATRFVAEFLGELNRLKLSDVACADGVARGKFEGRVLWLRGAEWPHGSAHSAILGIRPEHMALLPGCPPSGENAISAVVRDATYLGGATRLSLRTAGGAALTLTLPTGGGAEMTGAAVWLGWSAEHGVLLPDDA